MKSVWKWVLLGIAVFVVVFLIALPLWAGFPMMSARGAYGFGMMRGGMMGGGGLRGIGILTGFVFPILAIIGVAAFIYSLMKRHSPPAPPPAATVPCEYCGKPLDPGWVACPHCGKKKK